MLRCALTLAAPLMALCVRPLPGAENLRIVPPKIALAKPGEAQHFLVLSRAPDGQETPVTKGCEVSSSIPDIVSVDANVLTGRRSGRAEIVATCGGRRVSMFAEVGNRPAEMSVRFSPDVISVLTIKGCNNSGCHGSPAGQNGFKLSLFGYDVAADYDMILRKHDGRRVSLTSPEQSLLLRKPLFETPHGGGRLMTRDSEEYRTLLKWLQQGAKQQSGGSRLVGLEMYPSEQVLAGQGSSIQLVVIGRLSDGSTRDMTREVRYSSSDEAVATVKADGLVASGRSGLSTILARGMGQVAAAQVGVIRSPAGRDFPTFPTANVIDELVLAKLRQMNVRPAPLSTDEEFVRRVYLDTIGLPPPPEEAQRFLDDRDPGKRAKLIDTLLERPEYADFWTVKFEDWFRNNQLNSQGRSMGKFKEWLRAWIAEDRPYDRMVRELITSEGDTFQQPATNFWHPATDFMLKKFDLKKATPTVSRLFLGIRLECAECHNHPLENFTQDDFYGLSAFFARLKVKHGYAEYRRTWFLDEDGEIEHPVTKAAVKPQLLGGATVDTPPGQDRRLTLASWITSPANPYFARATVNRIWHEYFQTGLVEPFDDFRSTNPPTNRSLLDRLAAHFADSGFRFKPLHRLILNSRVYQLSSRRPADDADPSTVRLLFARYEPRKLPAEVLLDAVSEVTGVPHPFRNYPSGTRAMELYIPDSPDYFLVTFGFPRRDILCDRAKSPTLSQALHMINGDTVKRKLEARDNLLARWLEETRTDDQIVEALYERAYSRPPSERERTVIREYLASEQQAGRTRRRALEGVLWSLLNSKEFQINH